MKFDNKTFQQKYEAWKNGADYWKDIRGINFGRDTQAEEPSPEEQQQIDQNVQAILNTYDKGKDVNIAEDIIESLPFDAPLNEEHPILHKYKGGKDDSINTFVNRMGPLVGQQLNRYGYGDAAYYNVMRQLAYESNYGRSRVARRYHNYGGVGWNGKTYNTYKSDADFVKDYVRLMHTRYEAALRAKSTQDYARALKQKGYYEDSLQNYSRNLNSMNSLVRAARNHKNAHKDAYNYNVQLNDLEQDYEDAKNASPIIINSPSTRQPSTIRADVPTTLLGPTQEEIKDQQQRDLNKYKQQMYDRITQPSLPNMLNLLPSNNFGKDSYGQKFWWRRGNNLHFKGGKDKRSFDDWANKASIYKGIRIKGDPTYDYKGWYYEDPDRAYALLNDDPNAHFDDKWKTPYHPTFSNLSIYSNAKHPGGTWGRRDFRDIYYAPLFSNVPFNRRLNYIVDAENNGTMIANNAGMIPKVKDVYWEENGKHGYDLALDPNGDFYGGTLPAVQVIGKRGKRGKK